METTPDQALGARSLVYRRARKGRFAFAMAPVIVLIAALVLWVAGESIVLVWFEVAMAAVLEAVAFALNRLSVVVDDRRIVVNRVFFSQSMEWESVTAYYLPSASTKGGVMTISPMTGTVSLPHGSALGLALVLRASDGARMCVLGGLHPVDAGGPPLTSLLREKVMQRIYPSLHSAFEAGEPVKFGPLSVSRRNGLRFRKERISPSELRNYSLILRKDLLVLTQGDPERGNPAIRWDRVPNVDIFLSLFYELKKNVPTPSWA
ncbi:MAG: DUF6585 family protein [Acidimicrobiia bacterium]